ncbi:MAG: MFS transporter, partial [Dehalococcoidia bacterium]|nr:MFS transporter [Dehalococcoidia bacterium]
MKGLPYNLGAVVLLVQIALGLILFAGFQEYVPEHLAVNSGWAGYLLAAYGIGRFLFEGATGAVSDVVERKLGLVAGFALMVPAIALMGVVEDRLAYLGLAVFLGLGTAFLWPGVYAIASDLYPAAWRGRIVGFLNLAQVAGFGIGALLGALVVAPAPAALFAVAIGGVVLAVLVVLATVPRYQSEARVIEGRPSFRAILTLRLATFSTVVLLASLALSMIIPAIRPYGTEVLEVSFARLTVALIPAVVISAVLFIPAGHAADRFGRTPLFVAGQACMVAGLGTLAATTALPLAAAAAVFVMGGNVLAVPAWNAGVMDLAPPSHRGTVIGLSVALNGLGLAAGSALGGLVVHALGPAEDFAVGAVLAAAATVAILIHRAAFARSEV